MSSTTPTPNSEAVTDIADPKSILPDDEKEEHRQQYSNNILLGEYEAPKTSLNTRNGKGAGDRRSAKLKRRDKATVREVWDEIYQAESGINGLLHQTLVGSKSDLIVADRKSLSDNEEVNDSDEEESAKHRPSKFVNSARPKNETTEQRKLRKKAFKLQQIEKRNGKFSKKGKNIFKKLLTEQ